jgi:hypothetical protein
MTPRLIRCHEGVTDGTALARALAELDAEMARCGYTPGAPPWLTVGAARIDAGVCAGSTCDRCGRRGLEFYPAHRPAGRMSYRAYTVCPACGDWAEF